MTKHTSILAEFNTPYDLIHAAEKVRDKGIKKFDTYSPFPIHGMDDAMGLKDSNLDFIVLCGGAIGASIGLGLQIWVSHIAYPLLISGKDTLSIPAFIPVLYRYASNRSLVYMAEESPYGEALARCSPCSKSRAFTIVTAGPKISS